MDNASAHVNSPAASGHHQGKRKKSKTRLVAMAAGVVMVVSLIVVGIMSMYLSSTSSAIDGSKYQAVFLTNGQVYFGKLKALNGGYMKLADIYYLQTSSSTSSSDTSKLQSSSSTNSDVQLIKLGNEIHGPNDEMVISKDQILFFENLKKDGKVAASILKYQNQTK